MRGLAYSILKLWVATGLFFYYRKVKVVGKEKIPLDKPVLFLSNHQNALMDVLLIAVYCGRKPWFLTRSDVFKNSFLKSFFNFLQMMPVYRIRDGKSSVPKNKAVFKKCAHLLEAKHAILLFPEANHSLQRRVRPLSKGFTRIVEATLEQNPNLDVQLVPIGQNYAYPQQAGDAATLVFGNPIPVQDHKNAPDFISKLKEEVQYSLMKLTTHIPETEYDGAIQSLGENGEQYLEPTVVNALISQGVFLKRTETGKKVGNPFLKALFTIWNLPFILLWRSVLKPKVPEAEFEATFRFGFVLLVYPLVYGICFLLIWNWYNTKTTCLFVLGHAVVNLVLVKMGITSLVQRK
nr:lysophospholipid acyltransferase family protein [Allomuricauda sp.]